jgi:hypothetical protein
MVNKYRKDRWDNDLLQGLAILMKPDMPKEYHSIENIKKGGNTPARIIQRTVKELIRNGCGYPKEE